MIELPHDKKDILAKISYMIDNDSGLQQDIYNKTLPDFYRALPQSDRKLIDSFFIIMTGYPFFYFIELSAEEIADKNDLRYVKKSD